jgi:hypothetical protein
LGALSRAGRGARRARCALALAGAALGIAAPAFAQGEAPEAGAKIAVLPFRVHSARDHGQLGEELAGALRTQ